MSNDTTLVIVTYNEDFDKFKLLWNSVKEFGGIFSHVIVVLNDLAKYLPVLKKICGTSERVTLVHWSGVSKWDGPLDWWSQQYLKLKVSNIVTTDWYLTLDSDDEIFTEITEAHLFDYGHAWARAEHVAVIYDNDIPEFLVWYKNALRIWKPNETKLGYITFGCLTPYMLRTSVAKEVAEKMPDGCFDSVNADIVTLEFYLYFAFLRINDLIDTYYTSRMFIPEYVRKSVENSHEDSDFVKELRKKDK